MSTTCDSSPAGASDFFLPVPPHDHLDCTTCSTECGDVVFADPFSAGHGLSMRVPVVDNVTPGIVCD